MIFHTAAEEKYYRYFFKNWHRSIRKYWPKATFSLRFVGDDSNCDVVEYCKNNGILLDMDPTTLNSIMERYQCDPANARGYYALSRWISLPKLDDHIFMTDVDVMQANPLEIDLVRELDFMDFISISRQKVNKTNKMMILAFNKNFAGVVRDAAYRIINENPMAWDLDTKILSWMILANKFNWKEYTDLYCIDGMVRTHSEIKFAYFSSVLDEVDGILYSDKTEVRNARYRSFLKDNPGIFD